MEWERHISVCFFHIPYQSSAFIFSCKEATAAVCVGFKCTNHQFSLAFLSLVWTDYFSDECVMAHGGSSWRDPDPILSILDGNGTRPPAETESIHATSQKQSMWSCVPFHAHHYLFMVHSNWILRAGITVSKGYMHCSLSQYFFSSFIHTADIF